MCRDEFNERTRTKLVRIESRVVDFRYKIQYSINEYSDRDSPSKVYSRICIEYWSKN